MSNRTWQATWYALTDLSALLSHALPIWQIAICAKVIAIKATLDDSRHLNIYMVHHVAKGGQVSSGEANPQEHQLLCARQDSDDDEAIYTEHASATYSHQDTGAHHQGHCSHQTKPLMQLKRQYQMDLNDRIVLFCAGHVAHIKSGCLAAKIRMG